MKFLVVKGWLGFGDRLESLKMCVKYALDHKLQIYVDWTDSIWCHEKESFYSYFSLVNMPVLQSLDDIPSDCSFYPPYWKEHLKEPMSNELCARQKELNLNIGYLNKPIQADVIVYSCIGYRILFREHSFFTNVFRVIHPAIVQEVKDRQQRYNLSKCMGVHIRGTDRITRKRGREIPVQYMVVSAVQTGAFNGKPMVAISDDPASAQIWKNYFPQTTMLSKLSLQNSFRGGNHNASKDVLQTTKDIMNVDMLIDFFTLASCEQLKTTYNDSRFFQEALRLKPYIQQILS